MQWLAWVLATGCEFGADTASGFDSGPFADVDGDGFLAGMDCDDADPLVHPDATEICNAGIDDDCNGLADAKDGVPSTDYYVDADADGFGGGEPKAGCDPDPGMVTGGGDCEDADPAIHPGAPDVCNGVDDDCDAATSESGTVSVGADVYSDIQTAVDAAPDGATVRICDGTWYENVVLTRDVVLEGSGADVSIIDGDGVWSVVFVETRVDVTLRGLTLRGGAAGSIHWDDTSGGVQAWEARSLTIEASVLTENTGYEGGALMGPDNGDVYLIDSIFRGNDASRSGGGAYLWVDSGSALEIDGCEFTGNTAYGSGGGLEIDDPKGGSATITDTLFDGNVVTNTGLGWFGGGGLRTTAMFATLSGVTISNNEAMRGGGVSVVGDVVADATTLITGNHTLADGYGGGLYLAGTWTYGRIEDNSAAFGGGAALHYGELVDVDVEGNTAAESGGGLYVLQPSTVDSCTVTGNTSASVGGGIGTLAGSSATVVKDSAITENVAAEAGGGAHVQVDFESAGTDWGADATDNDPDDVSLVAADGTIVTYDAFDAAADFACDVDAGTCE